MICNSLGVETDFDTEKTINALLRLKSPSFFLCISTRKSIADLLLEPAARTSPGWRFCSGSEIRDTTAQEIWVLTA